MKNKIYEGTLSTYFETGMEGLEWILKVGESENDLISIDSGDELIIYLAEDHSLIFQSKIAKSTKNNKYSQLGFGLRQAVFGSYCRWLPHGIDPELWASFFQKKYTAKLIKNAYNSIEIEDFIKNNKCSDDFLPLQEKSFRKDILNISEIKPINLNVFSGISELNYKNMDHYNASLFYLLAENKLRQDDFDYIILSSKLPFKDIKYSQVSLTDFITDEDFLKLSHNVKIPFFDIDESVLEYLKNHNQNVNSPEYFSFLAEAKVKLKDKQELFFNDMKKEIDYFKLVTNNGNDNLYLSILKLQK